MPLLEGILLGGRQKRWRELCRKQEVESLEALKVWLLESLGLVSMDVEGVLFGGGKNRERKRMGKRVGEKERIGGKIVMINNQA